MRNLTPREIELQSKTTRNSLGSRIWMAMLGFSLCIAGIAGCTYLWLSFQKGRQHDLWIERPAMVIVSTIDDSSRTQHNDVYFRLEIHYRYEFQGENYLSSRYELLSVASRAHSKIERIRSRYPVEKSVTCFVNPDNPSVAVLKKPTKAAIYSIWFPMLLILFGLRMIGGIFTTKSDEKR